jgi:hypothetical protein
MINVYKRAGSRLKKCFLVDESWWERFGAEVEKINKARMEFAEDVTLLIILYAESKSDEDRERVFAMLETVENSKQSNTFDDRWGDPNKLLPMSREELKLGTFSFSLLVKRAFVDGQQCLDEEIYAKRVRDVWAALVEEAKPKKPVPEVTQGDSTENTDKGDTSDAKISESTDKGDASQKKDENSDQKMIDDPEKKATPEEEKDNKENLEN